MVSALYIHIPFCKDRCSYCDFFSTKYDASQVAPYLQALNREIAERCAGHAFDTVFIGGGTPTSMDAATLESWLGWLAGHVRLRPGAEWTVEANPGTIDAAKAAILRAAGVNRVSMGAQSFDPAILKAMKRIHNPEDVLQSVEHLRAAGIDNLNVDLIYGFPGQTLDLLRRDVEQVLKLRTRHLSAYCLGTDNDKPISVALREGRIAPVDEDVQVAMYDLLLDSFDGANGFQQYEISNFAQPGFECRHNLAYWRNDEYIGCGGGAFSFVGGRRFRNSESLHGYVEAVQAGNSSVDFSETLGAEKNLEEALVLRLRTRYGIPREWYERASGNPVSVLLDKLRNSLERGLVAYDGNAVRLKREGLFISNSIFCDLVEV